jgi:hypothetical protein
VRTQKKIRKRLLEIGKKGVTCYIKAESLPTFICDNVEIRKVPNESFFVV